MNTRRSSKSLSTDPEDDAVESYGMERERKERLSDNMAKMNCKCGHVLSTTQVPNDIVLRVYTDREWDEILDCGDTIEPWKIPLPEHEVWKCPNCNRIYVFEKGNNTPIMRYILEKD